MSPSTTSSSSSTSAPSSLLILTTSQVPLPVRYPHPHKPRLVIPPLVHRSLHAALDTKASGSGPSSPGYLLLDTAGPSESGGQLIIPHPDSIVKHDLPRPTTKITDQPKTSGDTDTSVDNTAVSPLVSDLELTVKLTLIGQGSAEDRAGWVDDALGVLAEHKGLGHNTGKAGSVNGNGHNHESASTSAVDTLLIGWKGVDYKGQKTAASEFFGCGAEGMDGGGGGEEVGQEAEDEVAKGWEVIRNRMGRRVGRLGTLYLPLGVLRRLHSYTPTEEGEKGGEISGPVVNMLDTPDCHHLPKEYTGFAKEQGMELWAGGGGEGADPLPDADLHNLLHEFAPSLHLSETIPTLIPLRPDQLKYDVLGGPASSLSTDAAVKPGVGVKWVSGYTVVSKARNVVVDKGYVVSADIRR